MPRPTAINAAQSFRRNLMNQEAQSAERMATIYNRIYTDLADKVDALATELAGMDSISQGQVIRLARMKAILQQVKEQARRFGSTTAQDEIAVIQSQAIRQGIDDALKLMEQSLPELPDEARRALVGSFARLPTGAIESAAGLTGPDSPLRDSLEEAFGDYVADQVANHIVDGIATGQNPRTIARQLNRNVLNGLGAGLSSVLNTVRTAQIKSYQTANHMTYRANSDIVKGWVWWAFLEDGRTCLSCIAMHGTVHSLDETLEDHHSGRCAPIPQTVTYADLGLDVPEDIPEIQTGEEWFNSQPESVQRGLMGGSKFDAWNNGDFEFSALSKTVDDPVYGDMRVEAPLKDLVK